MKRCGCSREHTLASWLALPFVGDIPDETIEMRNCRCGSTIAVEFTEDENGVRFYEHGLAES